MSTDDLTCSGARNESGTADCGRRGPHDPHRPGHWLPSADDRRVYVSARIAFKHIRPTHPGGRAAFWLHQESGIELWKGSDEGAVEWQIWTTNMGQVLGRPQPTLAAAKARAREIIAEMQASGVTAEEAARRTYTRRGLGDGGTR